MDREPFSGALAGALCLGAWRRLCGGDDRGAFGLVGLGVVEEDGLETLAHVPLDVVGECARTRPSSQWWIGRILRSTVFRLRKACSTWARLLYARTVACASKSAAPSEVRTT